jgi:diguanylate cyclase (GGDEF)-like protein
LLAFALVGVGVTLFKLRSDALDEAHRDLANLSLVLGEHTARAFEGIDLSLRNLQDAIGGFDISDTQTFAKVIGSERMSRELKEKAQRLPHVDVFSIVDSSGHLLNASRAMTTRVDLSDRDFYTHLKASPDAELFVSAPTKNRTTGTWTIYFVRRLNAPNGEFLGVVVGGVPMRYFEDLYRSFDLPRQESFTLARRDGMVLVRHPNTRPQTGQIIPASSAWHDTVARGGGTYWTPGVFDGIPRRVAVQPVGRSPLVISAAVAESEILAVWRMRAIAIAVGTLVIIGYAAFLIYITSRVVRRLKVSKEGLRDHNEQLTKLSSELALSERHLSSKTREAETILETMDQGLLMVDSDGVVVHCNSRARALLDLPDDLAASLPTFGDVLRYQWEHNKSGRNEGTFEQFTEQRMGTDHAREIRRPDGRVIEVRSTLIPSGGFVRTYTDITDRKRNEEKSAYLARHDDLTGLPNRVEFRERLNLAMAASRPGDRGTALLYLDLDGFKAVNDTRGHDVGDAVLVEAAQRLRQCVRSVDTVARLGGDEFAIILPFAGKEDAVAEIAARLVETLSRPIVVAGSSSTVGVSVGIAIQRGGDADDLLKQADDALYLAKSDGKGVYRFHRSENTLLSVRGHSHVA